MLESVRVRNYRSLRDFRLKLGRVTVVTGGNGVGKSNVYRSLALLQRLAEGRFAEAIAAEGGMPSVLWAGDWLAKETKRVSWQVEHSDFDFELECGLVPSKPGVPPEYQTAFRTDPDMKSEVLRIGGAKGKVMARRIGPRVELRDPDGKMRDLPLPFHPPESILSEFRAGARFPAVEAASDILLSWRFYHQFRTDTDSPMRTSRVGFWSPVLAHDGSNLAATLRTIIESGRDAVLHGMIEKAFPGIGWEVLDGTGRFQLQIEKEGTLRPFTAAELSDGTLRYFCLCAALLSPKPPPFVVLNEPETSLHPGLFEPFADLVASVPEETQILIVTHAPALADAIGERLRVKRVGLECHEGKTCRAGESGGRVWRFDDDEED